MSEALVELRRVAKSYGATAAVRDVSLAVGRGEFVVLLGPSGSGKTTLLSLIGGFVAPDKGEVYIDGADVTGLAPARRPTATVFQDYALFPHMTVAGNVGFGLMMHKVAGEERRRRVEAALALVGLADFGDRGVHQLSGGQQQRVALARAVAVEPKVLLLDEPLGALDLNLRRQMQDELTRIQKRLATTFIHVTHDQEEAMTVADTIVVLNRGRIEDVGPPRRVYLRPRSCFTATFMGDSNLIEGRVEAPDRIATPFGTLTVANGVPEGKQVTLMVRPEQLAAERRSPDAVSLGAARIVECLFQGSHVRLRLRAGADGSRELLLRLPPDAGVAEGEAIEVFAEPADLVMLEGS